MEIDSRPPLSQHPGLHMHARQSLPPPLSMRSPTTLPPMQSVPPKSSGNQMTSDSPAVRPLHEPPYSTQPSPRESSIPSASRRDFPPGVLGRLRSPGEVQNANNSAYPRSPAEVSLDAIERLQTQISQNSGALAAHTRDIRRGEESFQQLETSLRRDFAAQVQRQNLDIQRVDEAVTRMHIEMQTMRQAIEGISHELVVCRTEMQRGAASQLAQPVNVPDAALELMAQQVAGLAHKATEVDMLKVTIEIMKKKIYRMEQGVSGPGPSPHANAHGIHPSQAPQQSQNIPSLHSTPTVGPRDSPLANASHPPTHPSSGQLASSALPDGSHRLDSTPGSSMGWASINAGTKRTHANGMEASHEGAVHVPGSPKRQKTVAADSNTSYIPSQDHTPRHVQEHRESDGSTPKLHVPPTLPSQQSIPDSTFLSQTQQPAYPPYGTQDGPSDDSWRPESQRNMEHRPRGRPRGGPGSRGGRVRKSMPAQVHTLGTPEWEREDWQGVPESQAGPDGFYNHVARAGRGIARRGSGGGGRGGHAQSDRAASSGSQGIPAGFGIGSQNDPYSHTKKTRTKPIRNADGVLIRKDGRPDMRSQSSAANLRKVHARKEGEQSAQGSPTGFTPATLHYGPSTGSPDSPSPSGFAHPDPNATPSAQQKHSAIMGKMFPGGLLESRRQNDYTHQVFEEDQDHIAHPRNQHRRVSHGSAAKSALQIKNQQYEQNRVVSSDSPNDGDIDMDRAEEQGHAEPEEQTPGGQIEQEVARIRQQPAEVAATQPSQSEPEQVVPETQAVDPLSSATLSAETNDTPAEVPRTA
ncbi:hypothetical protein FB567DRAFT_526553 [Paraphoma chrysanthemicola]|uniref:Uncharacterized protein n=1 Tax=Paraphoma chrysanthemicola TaxID=798071 RepID=A0A8K0R4P7_9PLEO|nr:hypothetical protein FB567DRAFT_526553 [Paraphoma chrysanthemicola]